MILVIVTPRAAIQADYHCLTMAELRTSVSRSLKRNINIASRARRVSGQAMENAALDVAPSMLIPLRADAPRVPLSLAQTLIVARCGIRALQV